MKKLLILLFLVPFVFVMMGSSCEDEPTEAIDPPSGLELSGASDELSLVISWTPSSTADIDGYRIYYQGDTDPIYEGTNATYTHGAGTTAPALGEYEIVAYRGSEESDALDFDTSDEEYLKSGTFTIYRMDSPIGYDSGVGFNVSTGVAITYSMSDAGTNGTLVDIYYDTDGTFTSPDYLGGDWVNQSGFKSSSETYTGLEVVDLTGYNNSTYPTAVADGQIWQCVFWKTTTSTWNYAKMRIDGVVTTPETHVTVTYKYQTIEGWARVD